MTKAELDFYTSVPRALKAIVEELKNQNEALKALAQKIDELDINNN